MRRRTTVVGWMACCQSPTRMHWALVVGLVVITTVVSLVPAYAVNCPECWEPNPNHDPNDPYNSEPPCLPKPDGTPCGPPDPGCCHDGGCIAAWPLADCNAVVACPNLIPLPGFTPVPTTPPCGPLVGGIPALPSYFNPCCNVHDLCYADCGSNRADCDRDFIDCMTDICNGRSGAARARCNWWRNRARGAFIRWDMGRGAWCGRQMQGCLCCQS